MTDRARPIDRLLEIMARLRDPENGCPWDVKQSFATIAPYTIEEAYEVADAIQRGDMVSLREELGDLLLQVVYHAQMAREADAFDFDEVAGAIGDKMVRRHPHVFAQDDVADAETQTIAWEEHKAEERRAKGGTANDSLLSDLPLALPALVRAEKLGRRAARGGFDWPSVAPVLEKVNEELTELSEEVAGGGAPDRLAEEVGDLLFACTNLARHLGVDAEAALRGANAKFERRFRSVEAALARVDKSPATATLEEMEALWTEAK